MTRSSHLDRRWIIPWLEGRGGLTLAPSQREALRLAVASKALVITGGPGVGKTTLVNSILKVLVAKSVNVALCAPTGRAAKRMTETTGVEAKTIHRLLETDPKNGGFKRDETNPLACDLLVVDETSMVDVLLMKALVRALPPRAALLLVGDVDQLPSVGPGQVLADVIGSGAVPVVRLTEVFRQAATSRVIVNAHRINAGKMPEPTPAGTERSDFYIVDAAEPEIAVTRVTGPATPLSRAAPSRGSEPAAVTGDAILSMAKATPLHPSPVLRRTPGPSGMTRPRPARRMPSPSSAVPRNFLEGRQLLFLYEVVQTGSVRSAAETRDAAGRLWVTVSTAITPRHLDYSRNSRTGFIACVDGRGTRVAADGLGYTNECAPSADGRWMYVTETFARRLSRFPMSAEGDLGTRETVATFGPGELPDGLHVDGDAVWVACIVGNRLLRVGPDGSVKVALDGSDSAFVADVEREYRGSTMSRENMYRVGDSPPGNISSVTADPARRSRLLLGSLLGTSLLTIDVDRPATGH